MATGGGAGRFPVIPGGGAGRGHWLERHSEMGAHLGAAGKRGSHGEPIHSGVDRRRGTMVVEVEHRPREPMRWTVRSTKRLGSSWRQRWG
jgi:hypothetical protein